MANGGVVVFIVVWEKLVLPMIRLGTARLAALGTLGLC